MKILKDFLKTLWYDVESMAYPHTPQLILPLENWKVNSTTFLEEQEYSGVNWGKHLGEDDDQEFGTPVLAIGNGKVVYSKLHTSVIPPKEEGQKGSNWGNIIIIAHKNPETKKVFFSLYGHLGARLVEKSDRVKMGQQIGVIAPGWSAENGCWREAHLHLAIFVGQWLGRVLPGAHREGEKRTRLKDWVAPTKFIAEYNAEQL